MYQNILLSETHYAPGETLLVAADFHPPKEVEVRKEFYLHGHLISREVIPLSADALDRLMATWMASCSETPQAGAEERSA